MYKLLFTILSSILMLPVFAGPPTTTTEPPTFTTTIPGLGEVSVPALDIWGLLLMIGGLGVVLAIRQWRFGRRDKK